MSRIVRKIKRIPAALRSGVIWYKCIDNLQKERWGKLVFYLNKSAEYSDFVENRILHGVALIMLGNEKEALEHLYIAWERIHTREAESEYAVADYDYLLAYVAVLIDIASPGGEFVDLAEVLLERVNKSRISERVDSIFTLPESLYERISI